MKNWSYARKMINMAALYITIMKRATLLVIILIQSCPHHPEPVLIFFLKIIVQNQMDSPTAALNNQS